MKQTWPGLRSGHRQQWTRSIQHNKSAGRLFPCCPATLGNNGRVALLHVYNADKAWTPLMIESNVHPAQRMTFRRTARSAHSHSIVLASCSPRGSHASPHYLLSPPVMAVCFYGNRPCTPLKGEAAVKGAEWEYGARDDGQAGGTEVKREVWVVRAGVGGVNEKRWKWKQSHRINKYCNIWDCSCCKLILQGFFFFWPLA